MIRGGEGEKENAIAFNETKNSFCLTVYQPEVIIKDPPGQTQVFTGETVTLQCKTERGKDQGRSYFWYKNGQDLDFKWKSENTLKVTADHNAEFSCLTRKSDTDSKQSAPVRLSVSDPPKATLTVEPETRLFTGESFKLSCVINTLDGWTYQWSKQNEQGGWTAVSRSESDAVNTLTISGGALYGDQYRCRGERYYRPTSSQDSNTVPLTVEVYQSVYDTVNTLTIRGGAVISGDQYRCRGEIPNRPKSSQNSDSVTLTVEAPPKPTLTVEPKWSPLFTGESVTLKCGMNTGGRTYQWNKLNSGNRWTAVSQSEYHTVNRDTLTIRGYPVISGGQYRCRGEIPNRPKSSQNSDSFTLTVEERPTPVVSIQPDEQVFRGETVTLSCVIQGGGVSNWEYSWFKGGSSTSVSNVQYSISSVTQSDGGTYTCRGTVRGTSRYSHTSDITLTVSAERPKPELTSSHKGAAALIGNPVVLNCKLDQSAGWKFYWSIHTQNPENEIKTETPFYTISSVSVSDRGEYRCRAGRGDPVHYTHYSDALWITVTDQSPSVSLMVSPSRTQHFTTGSLSLSCEGQSDSTGWRVKRYTHSEKKVSNCSSGWRSVTGSTCNISSLSTSHTGVYWCESESGGSSDPVNITVHSGAVILESPVHPVPDGDPLTLRCSYRHTKPSNLTAEFYKNGSLLQTQTPGEMTIRTVSKSDEGLYHCKHLERGESPKSWISVRASVPETCLKVVYWRLTASPYLLVSIILVVKCSRARAKPDELNT
ncbi:hypothetical protein NFI96_000997, partial [Prochilodus magdalenae]